MTKQNEKQEVAGIVEVIEREAVLWQVWLADGHPEAWEAWKAANRAVRDAIEALPTAGGKS